MRVAALYDIHGNLPALEAVLTEVREAGADTILVGGDVASGPMPRRTLELLLSLPETVRFLRCNADRVLDFRGYGPIDEDAVWVRSRRWVAAELGEEHLRFLERLPLDEVLGGMRFCHGAPGSDEQVVTRLTRVGRLRGLLWGVEERVVVCGHTHVQFDRLVGGTRVGNAGSVGAPYEVRPGAYWLLAGPELSLRRTPYDVHEAASRIQATGYPNAESFVETMVTEDPARPERMSALIEGL